MDTLSAILLGIVEGITEFLPVSSTGHLILASHLGGIPSSAFLSSFQIAIQLGAILAVVTLYGMPLIRSRQLMARVAAAFVPTAVIGLVAYPFVKGLLGNPVIVVWALGVGGVLLILFEQSIPESADSGEDLALLPYRHAVLIGVAQSVALVPGVSRSAATIMAGLGLGLSRRAIIEFSFLLAIPTMGAATVFDLYRSAGTFTGSEIGMMIVGFLVAWVTALVAIRWLLRFLRTHDFTWFGVYRIAVAILFAVFVL